MSLLQRIPAEEVKVAAHTVWQDKAVAECVAAETVEAINHIYGRRRMFFCGKAAMCLVGGLFYLLGFRYDSAKKQRELADKLGTSDVSIRAAYRSYLEEFPELFPDVIDKLTQERDLRWYVLLHLKPKSLQSRSPVSTCVL
jgi:hypothetical protein